VSAKSWKKFVREFGPKDSVTSQVDLDVTRRGHSTNPFVVFGLERQLERAVSRGACPTLCLPTTWMVRSDDAKNPSIRWTFPCEGQYTFHINADELDPNTVHLYSFPKAPDWDPADERLMPLAREYMIPEALQKPPFDPRKLPRWNNLPFDYMKDWSGARKVLEMVTSQPKTFVNTGQTIAALRMRGQAHAKRAVEEVKTPVDESAEEQLGPKPPKSAPRDVKLLWRKRNAALTLAAANKRHALLSEARVKALRTVLQDWHSVMHTENVEITKAQMGYAKWYAATIEKRKTLCCGTRRNYVNLSTFGNWWANRLLMQEQLYKTHSSHAVGLMCEVAVLGATMHVKMHVHVLLMGISGQGKSKIILDIEDRCIEGSFFKSGTQSGKAFFDGKNKDLDWAILAWEEMITSWLGVDPKGGATRIAHGKSAAASDSAQTDAAALLREMLTSGTATHKRAVQEPDEPTGFKVVTMKVSGDFMIFAATNMVIQDLPDNTQTRLWAPTVAYGAPAHTTLQHSLAQQMSAKDLKMKALYKFKFQRLQYLCAQYFTLLAAGVVPEFDATALDAVVGKTMEQARLAGCEKTEDPRNILRVCITAKILCLMFNIEQILDGPGSPFDPKAPWTLETEVTLFTLLGARARVTPEQAALAITLMREQWEPAYITGVQVNINRFVEERRAAKARDNNEVFPPVDRRTAEADEVCSAFGTAAVFTEGRPEHQRVQTIRNGEVVALRPPVPVNDAALVGGRMQCGVRNREGRPCMLSRQECKDSNHHRRYVTPLSLKAAAQKQQKQKASKKKAAEHKAAGAGVAAAAASVPEGYHAGRPGHGDMVWGEVKDDASKYYIELGWNDQHVHSAIKGGVTMEDRVRFFAYQTMDHNTNRAQAIDHITKLTTVAIDVPDETRPGHMRKQPLIEFRMGLHSTKCDTLRIAKNLINNPSASVLCESVRAVLEMEGMPQQDYVLGMTEGDRPFLAVVHRRETDESYEKKGKTRAQLEIMNTGFAESRVTELLENCLIDTFNETLESEEEEKQVAGVERKMGGILYNEKLRQNELRRMQEKYIAVRESIRWQTVDSWKQLNEFMILSQCDRGFYTREQLAAIPSFRFPSRNMWMMNDDLVDEPWQQEIDGIVSHEYPNYLRKVYPALSSSEERMKWYKKLSPEKKRRMTMAYQLRCTRRLLGLADNEAAANADDAEYEEDEKEEEKAEATGSSSSGSDEDEDVEADIESKEEKRGPRRVAAAAAAVVDDAPEPAIRLTAAERRTLRARLAISRNHIEVRYLKERLAMAGAAEDEEEEEDGDDDEKKGEHKEEKRPAAPPSIQRSLPDPYAALPPVGNNRGASDDEEEEEEEDDADDAAAPSQARGEEEEDDDDEDDDAGDGKSEAKRDDEEKDDDNDDDDPARYGPLGTLIHTEASRAKGVTAARKRPYVNLAIQMQHREAQARLKRARVASSREEKKQHAPQDIGEEQEALQELIMAAAGAPVDEWEQHADLHASQDEDDLAHARAERKREARIRALEAAMVAAPPSPPSPPAVVAVDGGFHDSYGF
jgi:hypothetical protein